MTEAELRKQVVDIMTGWVGRKESNGTHKAIIDIYNAHTPLPSGYKVKYTDSWCATTVSAAFIKAGLTDIAPIECSCGRMIERFKKIKRWEENDAYRPDPGDIIMYDWDDSGVGDNTGWPEHVGLVASISGNTMKIVEGNMSDAVGYRTLSVGAKNIRGYCLPDFASKATSKTVKPVTSSKPTASTVKIEPAKSFDDDLYAGTYTVTAYSLYMRKGAGLTKGIVRILQKGDKVTCYGYYTKAGGKTWLLVKDGTGTVGFCSNKYLK